MSFYGTYSSLSARGFGGGAGSNDLPFYEPTGNLVTIDNGAQSDVNNSGNTVVYGDPFFGSGNPNLVARYAVVQNRDNGNLRFLLANANVNFYGQTVGIDGIGNTIIIGAEAIGFYTNTGGGPYIWVRSGANTWSLTQKIAVPSGGNITGNTISFGMFTAIDKTGNSIAVQGISNVGNNTTYGTVFVYNRTGNTFSLQQQIIPPNPIPGVFNRTFGEQLSFANNNNTLIIGEKNAYANLSGAIHIYNRTGNSWNFQNTIVPNNQFANQQFTLLTNNYAGNIIIGTGQTEPTNNNTAYYVFIKNQSNNYIQVQQLTNPPAAENAVMNEIGTTFITSSYLANSNLGQINTFYYGNDNYIQNQTIVGNLANQRLGKSIALNASGNILIVVQDRNQSGGLGVSSRAYISQV